MKRLLIATATLTILSIGLMGCLMHEPGDADAESPYTVQFGELKSAPNNMLAAKKKKTPLRLLKLAATLDWTVDESLQDVSVATCSDSMMLGAICAGTNGKTGSVGVPGPDGGTCTIKGTYQGCEVKEGCCTCTLVEDSRKGDCDKDGSVDTFAATVQTSSF